MSLLSIGAHSTRALLFGIGTYPIESEWDNIHGDNDVAIIANSLKIKNIPFTAITNEKATKKDMLKQLNLLINNSNVSDTVYIHFSCHGQQMEDLDNDENDALDEALIPYDAHLRYNKNKYTGENHLRDDELNLILCKLRNKIAKKGLVIVSIDACHAASAIRDNNDEYIRGTSAIFGKPENVSKLYNSKRRTDYIDTKIPNSSTMAPIIVISACKSYQNNVEIKGNNGKFYGALSLAISQALRLYEFRDVNKWLTGVYKQISTKIPTQTPVIESIKPLSPI